VDVAVEALFIAHGLQSRAGDNHSLGTAADLVASNGLKVLDHDLGLLRDVVGVEAHEAGEGARGLFALDIGVVFASFQ
jgi:hypothetical protein